MSKEETTLPNFLGIGAMRCGTTWFYEVLKSHPDIYLPPHRKEIHFFDRNYDKGLKWYSSFFPQGKKAKDYIALGEISPSYLFEDGVDDRILKDLPDAKFIVLLRNPVSRFVSHYNFAKKLGNTKAKDLMTFLDEKPNALDKGFYAEQLQRWFAKFDKDRFLILIFEEEIKDTKRLSEKLAKFLSVDPKGFSFTQKKINTSDAPRFKRLYAFSKKFNKFLIKRDMNLPSRLLKKFTPLFEKKATMKKGRARIEVPKEILNKNQKDIRDLEILLDRDLSLWKF